MPWKGDVHQCACSRATSLPLCILRIFKTGPGEPLMFLAEKRNSSPSPADPAQQMSYARALRGGGRSTCATRRLFRSHSRSRLRSAKNPSIPRDRPAQWISCCHALHESLTNPKSTGKATVIIRLKASFKNTSAPRSCFHGAVFKQAALQQQGVVLPRWWSRIQSMTYRMTGAMGPSASLRQPPALGGFCGRRSPKRRTRARFRQSLHGSLPPTDPTCHIQMCFLPRCGSQTQQRAGSALISSTTTSQPPATHPNMGREWRTNRLAGLPSVVYCTQRASSFHSQLTTPLQSDSTYTQGLLATYLTALSLFHIPPALDGSWELYLAGGPSARVQSLKRRTEAILQLLYTPQETACQVRASSIAACLGVGGCGCGFRDGPLAP